MGHFNDIHLSYQYGSERGKIWRVAHDINIVLSNGDRIVIPEGMETDLSSVPKFLWSIMAPYGDHLLGALIHDYLYQTDYKVEELGRSEARKFADKEFLHWTNKLNRRTKIHLLDNHVRYAFVRAFGWYVY